MNSSNYNLSFKKYLLIKILSLFMSAISLSGLVPLVTYYQYKSEAESTIINGKRLKFVGTLKEIYFIYIMWLVFTAVIIILYQAFTVKIIDALHQPLPSILYYLITSTAITFFSSIFIKTSFRKWKYRSTIIDNMNSFYQGNMMLVIITSTLRKILNVVSGGLFYPLIKEISYKYELRGVTLSSRKIECRQVARRMYKTWFKHLLFVFITFGMYLIYSAYYYRKMNVANIELILEK